MNRVIIEGKPKYESEGDGDIEPFREYAYICAFEKCYDLLDLLKMTELGEPYVDENDWEKYKVRVIIEVLEIPKEMNKWKK
jgi:hypothetical protein